MVNLSRLSPVLLLLVTACGGGGGGDDNSSAPVSSTPPAAVQPTVMVTSRQGLAAQALLSGAVGSTNAAAPPASVTQLATPTNTLGANVNWTSNAGAVEVIDQTLTLAPGARATFGFNVVIAPINEEIIFATQYKAALYVIPQSEAANFVAGRVFNYLTSYSFAPDTFGYKPLNQLPVGSYAIAIVNDATSTNSIRLEVQQQPSVDGFRYAQDRFPTVTQTIGVGARFVQYVTLGSTYRTMIDGGNSGGTVYVIQGSQAQNFLSGGGFQYITNQTCGSGRAAPGFCELPFPPGLYAIAYVNDTSAPQSIVVYGRDFFPL